MLYSTIDNIKHILSDYNIISINNFKHYQQLRFVLKNIHTEQLYHLDIENPLYNILYKKEFNSNFYINEELLTKNYNLKFKNIIFDSNISESYFYDNYINTPYYKRYGVIEHVENEKWSSEYFSFLELKDIVKIKNFSGLNNLDIIKIYGNFMKLSDNSLRFIFNPTFTVLENINNIYFAHLFILNINNEIYPMYYIIYDKNNSNDIYFEQTNLLVNSITNKGSFTVNLSELFNTHQTTLKNDLLTLNNYNNNQFIVNNIFNCGIFKNTNNGIIRFIPITFNQNFFHIIFNNMKFKEIYNYELDEQNVSYNGYNFEHNIPESNIKVSQIQNEKRIVPQNELNHDNILEQLLSLNSSAEYYNDVLFNLKTEQFQYPIYLIKEFTSNNNSPYNTQINNNIII